MIRHFGVLRILLDRMAAGYHFDGGAAQLLEFIEECAECDVIELIAPRMCNDGDAAGTENPGNRLLQCRPAMRHIARLAVDEILLEHIADISADTQLDDVTGKMRGRDKIRIPAEFERPFECIRD